MTFSFIGPKKVWWRKVENTVKSEGINRKETETREGKKNVLILLTSFRVCSAVGNFVKKPQLVISIDLYRTVLLNQLNTAPLLPNKEDSSQVMTKNVSTTVVVNKTGLEPSNAVSAVLDFKFNFLLSHRSPFILSDY